MNTGSTADQLAQRELAVQWGWPESLIMTIDDDLGVSGKRFDGRTGLREMCDLIEAQKVGLVLVNNADRLSRDMFAAEYFTRRALRAGILLWVKGKMYDMATAPPIELFGLKMQFALGWFGNENNRDRFVQAKYQQVKEGKAVSRAPIGFVKTGKGMWDKDPDLEIREAVDRIFDLYRRLGSMRKVVAYFSRHSLLFPTRIVTSENQRRVEWRPLSLMQMNHILHNPNYTDAYVYYRKKVTAADDWQPRMVRLLPRSEWSIQRGHHPGYITWEEWEENEKLLVSRRVVKSSSIGKGPALLQGIIRCARCDRDIRTVYENRDRVGDHRLPNYCCRPANREGTVRRCFSAAASALDRLVEQEILKALTPFGIDSALAAIDEVLAERKELDQAQRRLVQRAQDEVDDLYHRYIHVDLDNAIVKSALEREYRRALERCEEVKTKAEEAMREWDLLPLERTDAEELVSRAANLENLWATKSNEDRKRLVRTVVRRVWVHGRSEEATEIEIEWVGGLRERHRALRPKGLEEVVLELLEAGYKNPAEIRAALEAGGVLNTFGLRVSKQVVWNTLRRLGHHRHPDWVQALCLIRAMVLEGRTNREILARLIAEGPPHWLGAWTLGRLESAIVRLRCGRLPDGVSPLPPESRRDSPKVTPAEAVNLIRRGRAHRVPWERIAADLNGSGLQTATGRPFNVGSAKSLYSCWKHRGLVP